MNTAEEIAAPYEKAIEWVVMRMRGQRRKGGDRPMIIHSINVGLSLDRAGASNDVIIAGFLHDLIEDAGVTPEEVAEEFGLKVRDLVIACSHDNNLHQSNRDAANADLFRRAAEYGAEAIAIKVADAADNIATVHALAPDRQEGFVERAERWLAAGEHYLSPGHPLVAKLKRRIERAKAVVG